MSQVSAQQQFRKRQLPLFFLLYLLSRIPFGALYVLSDGLAWLFWKVIKYRKKVVLQNLENAFPEHSAEVRLQIAREFYRNLTDVFLETIKLTSLTKAGLLARVKLVDDNGMADLVRGGQSVIIVGSHHCNWEWVFAMGPASFPFPVDGVYKPLSSAFFENYMRYIRSRFGGQPVKMKETLRHLVTHKNQPRVLAMIADQTPPFGEIQHWTQFLHQETAFYAGAEKLARSFNYPVFFLHTHRSGRGKYTFRIQRIDNLLKPETASQSAFPLTDVYARRLENLIREEPSAYLWSHRRWKHKRPVTS